MKSILVITRHSQKATSQTSCMCMKMKPKWRHITLLAITNLTIDRKTDLSHKPRTQTNVSSPLEWLCLLLPTLSIENKSRYLSMPLHEIGPRKTTSVQYQML